MHSGAMICSPATLTAGIDVKPNDSPQPTTPLSVVTLTTSESTVLRSLSPHAPTSDFPPAVNGMRRAIASMCSIFMSMRGMLQVARPRVNPREAAFSLPRRQSRADIGRVHRFHRIGCHDEKLLTGCCTITEQPDMRTNRVLLQQSGECHGARVTNGLPFSMM